MRHVIELPDEIEQALEKRASGTGQDVPHLIELAVAAFVRNGGEVPSAGRRPDPPLDSIETVAPCDLPRTAPSLIAIERTSQRTPDPIADPV